MGRRHLSRLAVTLSALLVPYAWPQSSKVPPPDWATVVGRVTDDEGRPVAGAKVSVFPLDVAVSGAMPRKASTDEDGRYRLFTPAFPGKTRLCASKESAGYPDTQGLLFSSQKDVMPEISLTPGATLENVDIRLGPPDGVLDGAVVDGATGNPVSGARIILHRDDPGSMYSATLPAEGHFSFALPPAPIQIAVDAPGYGHWSYRDDLTLVPYVLLNSPGHRRILVELTAQKGAPH